MTHAGFRLILPVISIITLLVVVSSGIDTVSGSSQQFYHAGTGNSYNSQAFNTSSPGFVRYTIYLDNGTLASGNGASLSQGSMRPYSTAFDPADGNVFVIVNGNRIMVINSSTESVIRTLKFGSYLARLAYVPSDSSMYVTDLNLGRVWVINSFTYDITANITVQEKPYGIVYDPGTGFLYVANILSRSISVIDPANNSVSATFPEHVGDVMLPLLDPQNGYLYVLNDHYGIISVFDPANHSMVAYITGYLSPVRGAFDPSNGLLYLTNTVSDTVTVIDPAGENVSAIIKVGNEPAGITYNPENGYMYVSNYGSGNISVIGSGSRGVISSYGVSAEPGDMVFDPANGFIYVLGGNGTISMIETEEASANLSDSFLPVLLAISASTAAVAVSSFVALRRRNH